VYLDSFQSLKGSFRFAAISLQIFIFFFRWAKQICRLAWFQKSPCPASYTRQKIKLAKLPIISIENFWEAGWLVKQLTLFLITVRQYGLGRWIFAAVFHQIYLFTFHLSPPVTQIWNNCTDCDDAEADPQCKTKNLKVNKEDIWHNTRFINNYNNTKNKKK
jgi:hypothetical protein